MILPSSAFLSSTQTSKRNASGSPAKAALAAGRTTLSNIAREISAGTEFAFETTLSGSSTLEIMQRALAAGYLIDFSYLCPSSPDLDIGRVSMRVAAGGHHVPKEDVRRRYSRSLHNLPAALALAERARIFDNTRNYEPRLVFEMREQRLLLLHARLPDWFQTAFQIDNAVADKAGHIERHLEELRNVRR